jgi:hypothetical protein
MAGRNPACCDGSEIRAGEIASQCDDGGNPVIGERVIPIFTFLAYANETAGSQAGQMRRYAALGLAEPLDQRTDVQFTVTREKFENTQPSGIGKGVEEACEELARYLRCVLRFPRVRARHAPVSAEALDPLLCMLGHRSTPA